MKASNIQLGMEVQVKQGCRGLNGTPVQAGLVATVTGTGTYSAGTRVRLEHPEIIGGHAYVDPAYLRKVKGLKLKDVREDMVLQSLKAHTGRYGEEIPAGLVVNVAVVLDEYDDGYDIKVRHPDIDGGWAWVDPKNYRAYQEEVPASSEDYQVGDVLETLAEVRIQGGGGRKIPKGVHIKVVGKCTQIKDGYPLRVRGVHPYVLEGGVGGYIPYGNLKKLHVDLTVTKENVQVGTRVQVIRDCTGEYREPLEAGLVATVDKIIDWSEHPIKITHPSIEDGYCWVRCSDIQHLEEGVVPKTLKYADVRRGMRVRTVRAATAENGHYTIPEDTVLTVKRLFSREDNSHPVLVHYNTGSRSCWLRLEDLEAYTSEQATSIPAEKPVYSVGDRVLAGAEGAGWGCIDKGYAGKVCTVVDVPPTTEQPIVQITHPDVNGGRPYSTYTHLIEPYNPMKGREPVMVSEVKVGDWVTPLEDGEGGSGLRTLHKGTAYEVLSNDGTDIPLRVNIPEHNTRTWTCVNNLTRSTEEEIYAAQRMAKRC